MAIFKKDLAEMERKLGAISRQLCELAEATEITDLLTSILTEIRDTPQIESLNPIAYCDENGPTGFVAYTLDEETNVVTPLFFDAAGAPSTVSPLGEPCQAKVDFEFKFFETEKCLADGSKVKEILCIVFEDGLETSNTTFWIVNGAKVDTDPGVVDCVVCLPTISDAFADDLSTLLPGTSFTITKPDCCKIQVVTSAGSFTLREKETYYSTTDFKCPITVTGITIVSGTCSLADIHIISNFNS